MFRPGASGEAQEGAGDQVKQIQTGRHTAEKGAGMNLQKEGRILYGERYTKYMTIAARIKERGYRAMQQEINELWEEIMQRAEALEKAEEEL
jgi:hypothetical protein